MKKFITTLLSLALVIGMCPAMIANAEVTLSGTGVENDPYIIATAEDLKLARDLINANANGEADACFKVTSDIVLDANETWIPIAPLTAFTGTFDGANHHISNITVVRTNDNVNDFGTRPALGFFGKIEAGTVTNLGLNNVKVANNITTFNNKTTGIGGFAGYVKGAAAISNCYVKNVTLENTQTNQRQTMGGFIGAGGGSTPVVTNCYVYDATFNSGGTSESDNLGGFVGEASGIVIKNTNCYVADVTLNIAEESTSSFYAFGVINTTSSSYTEENCLSEADDIAGTSYNSTKAAGTVGMTKAGLVEAMTAVGYVTDATVNDGYPCLAWELPEDTLTGSGTESDPYLIESASDLKAARDLINANANGEASKYYELAADIVLDANETWIPIAPLEAVPFTGTFDGKNHTISNITAVRTNGNKDDFGAKPALGFFGRIHAGGTVKNLGLNNVQAVNEFTGYSNKTTGIGGLAGYIKGAVIISNCYVKNVTLGNVKTDQRQTMGGFIGTVGGSTPEVTNCYVYGLTINSSGTTESDYFGGFIGPASGIAMKNTNCYVADVTLNIADASTSSFYAFGILNTGSSSYAEVNCFSEATDIAKTTYDADKSVGEVGQTMADIAGIFNSLEGWQDGTNINAGYPALAWEPAPVILPYVVKQVSTAKDTVTLEINKADTTGDKIYIATYDSEGRLIAADVQNVAATITTAVSAEGAATVKVFIWNGVSPVIDAVVKTSY